MSKLIPKPNLKSVKLPQISSAATVNRLRVVRPSLNKASRKKWIRRGLITGNVILLLGVATFLVANRSASQTIRTNTINGVTTVAGATPNPLDRLSSAQIALTAAQMANLPELTAVRNQADSDSILLSEVPNDSPALAKPLIAATAEKSRQEIIRYTAKAGDTVASLSAKFNVTPSSIRWSNNINGDAITAGTNLLIPPINGIVYTVKSGDTPSSLASRYGSDANQIIVYNDAEVSGLIPGEQILIPNGTITVAAAPASFSFAAAYGGNGYIPGFCTWYVANRIAVPSNWGNANTWALYARLSGWTVSSVPIVGAIAQTSAGWNGHVAIVEDVSPDGSMIKYSDMNGIAGWNRVGYSDWVSASHFEHYIYH